MSRQENSILDLEPEHGATINAAEFSDKFYFAKPGDTVTIKNANEQEAGVWRVVEPKDRDSDCHRLINVETGVEAAHLYSSGILKPTVWREPPRSYQHGAIVNREVWESVNSEQTRIFAGNVTQARLTADEDDLQIVIDALNLCARLTEVGRYFPELTHILQPETIYCINYRIFVMRGCDCAKTQLVYCEEESAEAWNGQHVCDRWKALDAREWARNFARSIAKGCSPETIRYLHRNMAALHPVPELEAREEEPEEIEEEYESEPEQRRLPRPLAWLMNLGKRRAAQI